MKRSVPFINNYTLVKSGTSFIFVSEVSVQDQIAICFLDIQGGFFGIDILVKLKIGVSEFLVIEGVMGGGVVGDSVAITKEKKYSAISYQPIADWLLFSFGFWHISVLAHDSASR